MLAARTDPERHPPADGWDETREAYIRRIDEEAGRLPGDAPVVLVAHNTDWAGGRAADLRGALAAVGLKASFVQIYTGAPFDDTARQSASAQIGAAKIVLEMWWPDRGVPDPGWLEWLGEHVGSERLAALPGKEAMAGPFERVSQDEMGRIFEAAMVRLERAPARDFFELPAEPDVDRLARWVDDHLDRVARPEPPEPGSILAALHQLSDRAVEDPAQDMLGYGWYANALAALIENPATDTPLTIAVDAPWGVGKTSLANLVRDRLAYRNMLARDKGEAQPYLIVDFNAWQHDDSGDLGQALLAAVLRAARARAKRWRRFWHRLPLDLQAGPERGRSYAEAAAVATLVAVGGLAGVGQVLEWLGTPAGANFVSLFADGAPSLSAWILNAAAAGGGSQFPRLQRLQSALAAFAHDPELEASAGDLEAMRKELREHLAAALPEGGRLVVFIDDLERCRPPGACDALEFVNQVLTGPDVIVVVMAEMSGVAAQVAVKYEKLARTYRPGGDLGPDDGPAGSLVFGRRYLQKIIQLQLSLPHPSAERLRTLLAELLKETPQPPAQRAVVTPRPAAGRRAPGSAPTPPPAPASPPASASPRGSPRASRRAGVGDQREAEVERLSRVGASYEPERRHIDQLETASPAFRRALEAAWPLLPGTPRHAKRFINRLRVQTYVAESAGLLEEGSGVAPSDLALWTAVQERWPEVSQAAAQDSRLWPRLVRLAPSEDAFRAEAGRRFPSLADIDALRAFVREHNSLANALVRIVANDATHTGSGPGQPDVVEGFSTRTARGGELHPVPAQPASRRTHT